MFPSLSFHSPSAARAARSTFETYDRRLTRWMARHGMSLLRVSVGIVFFWFGILKFFPGVSPAQDLATRTIGALSFGLVPGSVSVPLLALLETTIGVGLISGRFLRVTLLLLAAQMAGTVTPLLLFPGETFTRVPYAPTLEGQYIIKNIVLVSAAILIGATVRGGLVIADPAAAREARAKAGE